MKTSAEVHAHQRHDLTRNLWVEGAFDERERFDAGDHLEPPAAATTVHDIDGEHALESLRPAHADMLGNSGGPVRCVLALCAAPAA